MDSGRLARFPTLLELLCAHPRGQNSSLELATGPSGSRYNVCESRSKDRVYLLSICLLFLAVFKLVVSCVLFNVVGFRGAVVDAGGCTAAPQHRILFLLAAPAELKWQFSCSEYLKCNGAKLPLALSGNFSQAPTPALKSFMPLFRNTPSLHTRLHKHTARRSSALQAVISAAACVLRAGRAVGGAFWPSRSSVQSAALCWTPGARR